MLARTVALALAGAASGCVSAAQPGAPSGHATSVHVEPDDPTMRTAGAPTCRVDPPQTLGVLAAEDTWFQATFGERGGLAVWNSRDGARVRSLSREGAPSGPARSLDLPPGAMPIDAVADAGGFDVVSRRLIGASGEPRAMQAFVQTTSLDGAPSVLGGQITVPYGPLAGLAADGAGRLAFVTTNGVVVTAGPAGGGSTTVREVAQIAASGLVMVRGSGQPSFLASTPRGTLLLLNDAGMHEVEGAWLPGAGDAHAARLHARWGIDGRIHVWWTTSHGSTWIQYGVLEPGPSPRLVTVGAPVDAATEGWVPPFDDYVTTSLLTARGRVQRSDVFGREVGDAIDIVDVDPSAFPGNIRVAWSGRAFLLLYAAMAGPVVVLRASTAHC